MGRFIFLTFMNLAMLLISYLNLLKTQSHRLLLAG